MLEFANRIAYGVHLPRYKTFEEGRQQQNLVILICDYRDVKHYCSPRWAEGYFCGFPVWLTAVTSLSRQQL